MLAEPERGHAVGHTLAGRTGDGSSDSKPAAVRGEVRGDHADVYAWAIMGMNVFLGLRYGVWGDELTPEEIAGAVATLLRAGLSGD